jgi:ABC-type dipeptide/oligopeptide/nickel transport system ATPase component
MENNVMIPMKLLHREVKKYNCRALSKIFQNENSWLRPVIDIGKEITDGYG